MNKVTKYVETMCEVCGCPIEHASTTVVRFCSDDCRKQRSKNEKKNTDQ